MEGVCGRDGGMEGGVGLCCRIRDEMGDGGNEGLGEVGATR